MFDTIIFSNLCEANIIDFNGDLMNKDECEEFNSGILKQGMYSSVIKYWDTLIQYNEDFFYLERNETVITDFVMADLFYDMERMERYYFRSSLRVVINKLEEDIDNL